MVTTSQSGGGKGGVLRPKTKTTEYRYYASFAVALCEGEIAGIGRVWADGAELDLATVTYRVHTGSETQPPDSLIEAHEGAGNAPAFRGTAYVVFERLALADFGNRIPQLSFEVHRPVDAFARRIRAVTLIPGAGEFAYAQEPVTRSGSVDVIAGQPFVLFLDLPLLRGDEPPAAGYIAAAQSPWPGPIAVYRSPAHGLPAPRHAFAPAVTGVTLDPLPTGATSRLDRATAVRVKLDRARSPRSPSSRCSAAPTPRPSATPRANGRCCSSAPPSSPRPPPTPSPVSCAARPAPSTPCAHRSPPVPASSCSTARSRASTYRGRAGPRLQLALRPRQPRPRLPPLHAGRPRLPRRGPEPL